MSKEIVILSTGLDRLLETMGARRAREDVIDDLEMDILKQRAHRENVSNSFLLDRIEYWTSITIRVDTKFKSNPKNLT